MRSDDDQSDGRRNIGDRRQQHRQGGEHCGRAPSGNVPNVTINLIEPGSLYGDRVNAVDVRVASNTTAQLYAYRRSAQAIEQGEILPAFTSELALTQRLAGDRVDQHHGSGRQRDQPERP